MEKILLIDVVNRDEVDQKKSGPYYIRVPTSTGKKGVLLKKVAERLNIDLIIDYF